ncbi:MAG: hypothetical protein WC521_06175 [Bdellovibrionales bacterium]
MNNDYYFKLLEEKFLTYKELSSVAVSDNGEPMVRVGPESSVRVRSIDERMRMFTGSDIFVRQSLIQKLHTAQDSLSSMMKDCALEVVYGHRHLTIQLEMFEAVNVLAAYQQRRLA